MTRTANPIKRNTDVDRWNKKYQLTCRDQVPLLNPEGEPELVLNQELVAPRGLALEVACGKGRNAMYLATMGYEVIASDCAFNGLVECLPLVRKLSLQVWPLVCDIEKYPFPKENFDLVSVVRYLNRSLFEDMKSWVTPGGTLFYKTFNSDFLAINPAFNPDYVVEKGELEAAFSDFSILASGHGKFGTSFILGRKPDPKTSDSV